MVLLLNYKCNYKLSKLKHYRVVQIEMIQKWNRYLLI